MEVVALVISVWFLHRVLNQDNIVLNDAFQLISESHLVREV